MGTGEKSCDFLIENQNDHPDFNTIMQTHREKEMVILNRLLFNVLDSIRMYREQVLQDLSGLDSQMKSTFEEETNSPLISQYIVKVHIVYFHKEQESQTLAFFFSPIPPKRNEK